MSMPLSADLCSLACSWETRNDRHARADRDDDAPIPDDRDGGSDRVGVGVLHGLVLRGGSR